MAYYVRRVSSWIEIVIKTAKKTGGAEQITLCPLHYSDENALSNISLCRQAHFEIIQVEVRQDCAVFRKQLYISRVP